MFKRALAVLYAGFLAQAQQLASLSYNFVPPGQCQTLTSLHLNIIPSITVGPESIGIQLNDIAYPIQSTSFVQPNLFTISTGGQTVSVSPSLRAAPCCANTGCSLASISSSWYNAPCGAVPGCSPSLQWYSLSVADTNMGTCAGCGIYGSTISLDIGFGGDALSLGNFGSGPGFFISYYLIPRPTSTSAATTSAVPTSSAQLYCYVAPVLSIEDLDNYPLTSPEFSIDTIVAESNSVPRTPYWDPEISPDYYRVNLTFIQEYVIYSCDFYASTDPMYSPTGVEFYSDYTLIGGTSSNSNLMLNSSYIITFIPTLTSSLYIQIFKSTKFQARIYYISCNMCQDTAIPTESSVSSATSTLTKTSAATLSSAFTRTSAKTKSSVGTMSSAATISSAMTESSLASISSLMTKSSFSTLTSVFTQTSNMTFTSAFTGTSFTTVSSLGTASSFATLSSLSSLSSYASWTSFYTQTSTSSVTPTATFTQNSSFQNSSFIPPGGADGSPLPTILSGTAIGLSGAALAAVFAQTFLGKGKMPSVRNLLDLLKKKKEGILEKVKNLFKNKKRELEEKAKEFVANKKDELEKNAKEFIAGKKSELEEKVKDFIADKKKDVEGFMKKKQDETIYSMEGFMESDNEGKKSFLKEVIPDGIALPSSLNGEKDVTGESAKEETAIIVNNSDGKPTVSI